MKVGLFQSQAKTFNQKGFSLLEMMLVLLIISLISSITFLTFSPVWKQTQLDQFFDLLEKDILYTQMYALNNERQMHVLFQSTGSSYLIKESGAGKILLKRTIAAPVHLEHMTLPNPITFLSNGNIQKPGTMVVTGFGREFTVTFLLGKGRFYVREV